MVLLSCFRRARDLPPAAEGPTSSVASQGEPNPRSRSVLPPGEAVVLGRRLGILLDISPRNLEGVLYFAKYIVTWVDEDARAKLLQQLEDEAEG